MPKINYESQFQFRCIEIVDGFASKIVDDFRNCFDLNDDLTEANKVRYKVIQEYLFSVLEYLMCLGLKRNFSKIELYL